MSQYGGIAKARRVERVSSVSKVMVNGVAGNPPAVDCHMDRNVKTVTKVLGHFGTFRSEVFKA